MDRTRNPGSGEDPRSQIDAGTIKNGRDEIFANHSHQRPWAFARNIDRDRGSAV